jgi:hypothetical protein
MDVTTTCGNGCTGSLSWENAGEHPIKQAAARTAYAFDVCGMIFGYR